MNPADVYTQLQAHALAKPGATEDYPWDDVAWKVKGKMFGVTSKDSNVVSVKSTLEKQASLVMHPSIEISKYVGRFGWVTITIEDKDTLDLAKDLMDESYEMIAAKGSKGKAVRKE